MAAGQPVPAPPRARPERRRREPAGLQRWREEMRAKIAAGQATKFPSGRKPGAQWVTKRMSERKVLAEQQELRRQVDPSPAAVSSWAGPSREA